MSEFELDFFRSELDFESPFNSFLIDPPMAVIRPLGDFGVFGVEGLA